MSLTFGATNFQTSNDPASIQNAYIYIYIYEYKRWVIGTRVIRRKILRLIEHDYSSIHQCIVWGNIWWWLFSFQNSTCCLVPMLFAYQRAFLLETIVFTKQLKCKLVLLQILYSHNKNFNLLIEVRTIFILVP